MLHLVGKQVYKFELSKKWRIHIVFHMSLFEQNSTRKKWVEKAPELDTDVKSKKYEVEVIWDSMIYAKESEGYLQGLYYLVTWKSYPKEENTWEPVLAVQHLRRLIRLFHKDQCKKPIVIPSQIDDAPPMIRLTVKPMASCTTKRKQDRPANSTSKQAKNWAYMTNNQQLNRASLGDWGVFFLKTYFESLASHLNIKRPQPKLSNIGFFPQSSYQVKRFFIDVN